MGRKFKVELELSTAEAAGLEVILKEGSASLLTDFTAARFYIGKAWHIKAARSGLAKAYFALGQIRAMATPEENER